MGPKLMMVALLFAVSMQSAAQALSKYEQFEIKGEDLVWQNTYPFEGSADSLRSTVVRMLKSKFFTFNVIRNEKGYNGEIKHYKVNCKRYDRTYLNTPRMYWDGEWTGKFIVELETRAYRVTIYALYFDTVQKSTDYFRTEKEVRGRYLDAVSKRNRASFRKDVLSDLTLMGVSLREEFDVRNTVAVEN